MNTKYLWDKEGNDDEIERLESALSGYRFQADAVPGLRQTEVAVPARRFGWFQFSLAAGLAAAMLLIAATAFVVDQYRTPKPNDVAVKTNDEQPLIAPDTTAPPPKVDQYYIDPLNPEDKRKIDRHYIPPVVKPIRKVAPPPDNNIARNKKLTKDERYAYDQLLVALWLTGSKLKVVQDTINRVDDKKSFTDKNLR
jgi:hypothetical protein